MENLNAQEYKQLFAKKPRKVEKPRRISTSAESKIQGEAMPLRININPLSVNDAWRGERRKTDDYKAYRLYLLSILPKRINLPEPPYEIHLTFGLSSVLSDWDNPIKPFQDVLSEMYGFNDKLIKRAIVDIDNVKKNEEFITFEIRHLDIK